MYRPCGVFDETYAQNIALIRTRRHWILLILGLALLMTMPLYFSGRVLHFVNLVAISMIAAQGLNILTGFAGQISLGQSAFMAVGAYSAALLTVYLHFPFWLAIPAASMITGLVGVLFGAPSLRIKGFYLAMATFSGTDDDPMDNHKCTNRSHWRLKCNACACSSDLGLFIEQSGIDLLPHCSSCLPDTLLGPKYRSKQGW